MRLMLLLASSLLVIARPSLTTQTEQGQVGFSIKKAVATVHGQLTRCDYTIELNEAGEGTIRGTADVASIATNSATRDAHLQAENWFYAEKFSRISIQSKRISKQPAGGYLGTFEITIRGKSRIKDIPFIVSSHAGGRNLTSTFTLSRRWFGIGGGLLSLLVGDEVTVELNLPFENQSK